MELNQFSLFHISQNPDIQFFQPRIYSQHSNLEKAVVFGVSIEYLYNYLLPRDCPRISFYALDSSNQADIEKYLMEENSKKVLVIEKKWLPIISNTVLHCYALPIEPFTLWNKEAGYYISQETITPITCISITSILEVLLSYPIELRLVDSLQPLANLLPTTSLHYSMIRLRNANFNIPHRE